MENNSWLNIVNRVSTPSYVVDVNKLRKNCYLLKDLAIKSGCKILLALKAFAVYPFFRIIREYLHGVSASSVDEARLGYEEFGGEVHAYTPAFNERNIEEFLKYVDHFILNSFSQLERFGIKLKRAKNVEIGLRLNPCHSEVEYEIYNPCRRYSRLGIVPGEFREDKIDIVSGFHFHTLCAKNFDALERTWLAFEKHFGRYLNRVKWLNMGGGHYITKEWYDREGLVRLISHIQDKYKVGIYLEPGEAVVLDTGVFITEVVDIIRNEIDIAILDSSAATHLPDVLEMPYTPLILGAGKPGEFKYRYLLGGASCLAGDFFGEYSFKEPLKIGTRLIMLDMAQYTIVKNTTFNGIRLPSIWSYDSSTEELNIIREFNYYDFKNRMGPFCNPE